MADSGRCGLEAGGRCAESTRVDGGAVRYQDLAVQIVLVCGRCHNMSELLGIPSHDYQKQLTLRADKHEQAWI